MMKKLTTFITCIAMCLCLVMPVSAAELQTETSNTSQAVEIVTALSGSTYFSGITTKLNSLYGANASANISSGTCLGNSQSITSVTVYSRVSSGSSGYTLTVKAPSGTTQTITCGTSSTTYTFNGFNGEDPDGRWTVTISSNGTVSTVTCTLKVYYTYS